MISLEYVNGSISLETEEVCRPFESFMESCKNDINKMFADFNMFEEKVTLEAAITGSALESTMMVYESEKKNIFTRIGEMVVAIYNKFVEFVDMIIDKIKTFSFRKKSDLQKLDILLKKHPDLKNEAIAAFNKGALDLSDVRSLKELDATFDEILKMARKQDIDPKSLRGKWEKAKEKFEKDEKSWTVVKVAAAATTIIGAAVAIKTFHSKCLEATNKSNEEKKKLRESRAEILEEMKKAGYVSDDMGKWQLILQMWRYRNEKYSALNKERLTVIDRLANGITKFLDKFDKGAGKAYSDDLSKVKERMDKAAEDARQAGIDKVKAETRAKKEAEDAFNKSHYTDTMKEERDKAYQRKQAEDDFKKEHRRDNMKEERDKVWNRKEAEAAWKRDHPDDGKK